MKTLFHQSRQNYVTATDDAINYLLQLQLDRWGETDGSCTYRCNVAVKIGRGRGQVAENPRSFTVGRGRVGVFHTVYSYFDRIYHHVRVDQ